MTGDELFLGFYIFCCVFGLCYSLYMLWDLNKK